MSALILLLLCFAHDSNQGVFADFQNHHEVEFNRDGFGDDLVWPKVHKKSSHSHRTLKRRSS
ncbi:MAG: hypothetical protein QM652_05280 [Legionella sp.]|uniref:hypothetical protein n=1 Tax=Legionella sp. TaxID=459 RepID=UPI0039E3EFF3